MNKIVIVFVIFLLNSASINAQENFEGEIRWGSPVVMKKKERGPFPIGAAQDSFYTTKTKKEKTYLQTFGLKSLSIEKEVELDMSYKGFDLNQLGNFVFAEKVVFITSYINKKTKKQHYLLHELENESRLSKPIELAMIPWLPTKMIMTKKAIAKAKSSGAYSFSFIVSDDYETLMVTFQNNDGDTETVLFDKDLDEVSHSIMKIPYENFNATNRRLSNQGRLYTVGYESTKEDSKGIIKREVTVAGDYHILIYDAVNGDMEDIELDIDKEIISVAIKIMPDESTVAYGMYSNEDAKGISGSFFQKLGKNNSVEFTTLEEFEEDFITQHWTAKQKKKAEKKKKNPKKKSEPSLYSYIMHDLAIKENGDMTLLAEQYYMYVTSHTYTDANGNSHTSYTYHYIYNDIVAVNCSQDGEVTWKQKVKKRQHSTNDGGYFSSFYTIIQENQVFLMYNDKEANMDDSDEAVSKKGKRKQKRNTVAALITLSEDGESNRKTLFDFEGEEIKTLVPKRCKRMSPNEVFLFSEGHKRTKVLGWMTL